MSQPLVSGVACANAAIVTKAGACKAVTLQRSTEVQEGLWCWAPLVLLRFDF